MSDRCEPPEELRGQDGWHWLRREDREAPMLCSQWHPAGWWDIAPFGSRGVSPEDRHKWGWRYLAPVTPPAEVERLRAEGRKLDDMLAMLAGMASEQNKRQSAEAAELRAEVERLRADLARLVAAGENVINATNACPRFERGAGGMSIDAQIRRTEINQVPAWPFEELMDALAAIKERKA